MTKKISLTDISAPVKTELEEFNKRFKGEMRSDVKVVDLIVRYILKQKGKKIRPLLVLLTAKVAGGINERSYRGANLVELLHTATLIHDDVVDEAPKRRGLPSINYIWKNKVGVLIGDYLLSKGLMLAVESGDYDFLRTITKTVKRMSEGELLQINKARKLDIDQKTYFRIISDKTASLISTCCEIGAMSASEDTEIVNSLTCYGENLGIAFQIRDDILDITGKSSVIGKPLGGDIKERKLTLPLIHALEVAGISEKKKIIGLIKNGKRNDSVSTVIDFIKDKGGIEYSYEKAAEYTRKAIDALKIFPDSPGRIALKTLVDFVIERKN